MCLPSLPRCELKDASVSRDPMPVIPANAGIQFKYVVRSTQRLSVVCCARHSSLDLK